MKKVLLISLVISLLLPIGLATAATPVKGGNLVVCQPAEPPGLDPTSNTAAAIGPTCSKP